MNGPLSPRDLPPVHLLLDRPELARFGRSSARRAARAAIDDARGRILQGFETPTSPEALARIAAELLKNDSTRLRRVLNATGILLHTGLGRAPLAASALEAVVDVARGYSNLEFNLETGERGQRTTEVSRLLRQITGAEAATVVNNNAGATVLALRALAGGREVVVSRGQLVEIGGSFRLPEIIEASGADLVEVGTTNCTRLADYERAITPKTAALILVHPSNYRVEGFTESVSIQQLAPLAHASDLLAIDDVGSGALAPGLPPDVSGEPTILESLAAGADLVLCSADKLLGGPQSGLILGSKSAIARIESDPLMRALRVDKLTLAALEATLRLVLDPEIAARQIPLWAFLTTPLESLTARAERLAARIRTDLDLTAEPVASNAFLGGGSLPGSPRPSAAVRIVSPTISESNIAHRLRTGPCPVIPRVQAGAVFLDLRAISPEDDPLLLEALRQAAQDP